MSEKKFFHTAVIGAGPGGYTAAIRAAQLGKSVVLIEKNALGGTCLNVGCIPTKTLLASAAILHQIQKASEFGISTGSVTFHYAKMKERKDQIVSKIRSNLEKLLQSNNIQIIRGTAQFESPHSLKILGSDSGFIHAENIIIATGSVPFDVKSFPCDHKRILNSTSLLEITEVPKSLAIIGGGYIGCEFASLFADLGSKVTILEALPTILSMQGAQIAQFMTKTFTRKGMAIRTGVTVQSVLNQGDHVKISLSDQSVVEASMCLVSIGRKTCVDELKLDKAGLHCSEKGMLHTNAHMETAVKGIYAIGDVTGKAMLAHVASHQGLVAASNAAGLHEKMHYETIPSVIFTNPEIATVGLTYEQAESASLSPISATFPFQALGKAQASADTEGFSQLICAKKTGQIVGATVVGHEASNLIAEMALAIQQECTIESIIETIHAHPTMAEAWLETALLAAERPIHLPPKRKP